MTDSLTSNPLDTAVVKLAVLKVSFGICALPEAELFRKLEEFYLEAYARGVADRPSDETPAGTCTKCGAPVHHRPEKPGEFDHVCTAAETPATPETRPCNCAPDYCMAAGMLRRMMSPYVRCKRPPENGT